MSLIRNARCKHGASHNYFLFVGTRQRIHILTYVSSQIYDKKFAYFGMVVKDPKKLFSYHFFLLQIFTYQG